MFHRYGHWLLYQFPFSFLEKNSYYECVRSFTVPRHGHHPNGLKEIYKHLIVILPLEIISSHMASESTHKKTLSVFRNCSKEVLDTVNSTVNQALMRFLETMQGTSMTPCYRGQYFSKTSVSFRSLRMSLIQTKWPFSTKLCIMFWKSDHEKPGSWDYTILCTIFRMLISAFTHRTS